MKNLKMFAIAVMAFAVMAMGVHATRIPDPAYKRASEDCGEDGKPKCVAKINDNYYTNLSDAIGDAQDNNGGVITMLEDVAGTTVLATGSVIYGENSAYPIKTNTTIDLGTHNIDLGAHALYVNNKGTLKITGTGEVKSTAATLVTVEKEGSFETSGALALTGTTTLIDAQGNVTIGADAELKATTIVQVSDHAAVVKLNGKVGTSKQPAATSLVAANGSLAAPSGRNAKGAQVTVVGGEFYTSRTSIIVDKGIEVTIDGGKLNSTITGIDVVSGKLTFSNGTLEAHSRAINVKGGDTVINGGTIKSTSTGFHAVIVDQNATAGTLTINKGTISTVTKGQGYALYLDSDAVEVKVNGGQFNSSKDGNTQYPAIFIRDALLKGLDENQEDQYKGMITGGKFLYMIVGEANKSAGAPDDYSAADVAKYLIAEGLEERTEGDYKLVGNGAGDTPADEPGTTEPGDTTIPPVPQTNDNILVYAGLGLVSLASVAFTTRKRED